MKPKIYLQTEQTCNYNLIDEQLNANINGMLTVYIHIFLFTYNHNQMYQGCHE